MCSQPVGTMSNRENNLMRPARKNPGRSLKKFSVPALRWSLAALFFACCCAGQEPPPDLGPNCKSANLEEEKYTVHSSKIENPFHFLPTVRVFDKDMTAKIPEAGQPFTYASARDQPRKEIHDGLFPPTSTSGAIRFRFAVIIVEAYCPPAAPRTVDLVYRIYSSQLAPALTGTPEGQTEAKKSPQTALGAAPKSNRFTALPTLSFDSTDKVSPGGKFKVILFGDTFKLPLQFEAEGQGSQTMQTVHAALVGSKDSTGPVIRSSYQLNYDLDSLPTGAGAVQQKLASLQYSGTTRAFLQGNVSARFGGLVEKGNVQTDIRVPVVMAASASSAVNALKFYGGLDSRWGHNVLSASMGLELATADVGAGIQWKKYVADVHHDYWHNLGNRHSIDLDSRLTIGDIQGAGALPIAERFFGGNHEQMFMPGDSWQIRSNPVIRAIPGSRFYQTGAGPGADRFVAYNLTAAFAVWRKPLIPAEAKERAVKGMDGEINSAISSLENNYNAQNQHFQNVVTKFPDIVKALGNLNKAVAAAPNADEFGDCAGAVRRALRRAGFVKPVPSPKIGTVADAKTGEAAAAMIGTVADAMDLTGQAITACDANSPAGTPPPDLKELKAQHITIAAEYEEYKKFDMSGAAHKKATSEMAFPRRIVHTMLNDMDLISVSPVGVFDVAQIGPSRPGLNVTRYGPGVGLRAELASSINFTVGYARSVNPGPGEGSGAVFFSMGIKDLFH